MSYSLVTQQDAPQEIKVGISSKPWFPLLVVGIAITLLFLIKKT